MRPAPPRDRGPDGPRRLARRRLAGGVRRPGLQPDRAVHLLRRVDRGGAPLPMLTINTVGPDHHARTAPTSRSSSSCRRSCEGEIHFCIGYTEPDAGTDLAVAQHPRRSRRRRVRDQRPEDSGRAWRATPTTSGSRPAPTTDVTKHAGISLFSSPWTRPGIRIEPAGPAVEPRHQRTRSSTTCESRRSPIDRRGERAAGGSSPASSTTNG